MVHKFACWLEIMFKGKAKKQRTWCISMHRSRGQLGYWSEPRSQKALHLSSWNLTKSGELQSRLERRTTFLANKERREDQAPTKGAGQESEGSCKGGSSTPERFWSALVDGLGCQHDTNGCWFLEWKQKQAIRTICIFIHMEGSYRTTLGQERRKMWNERGILSTGEWKAVYCCTEI